MLKYTRRMKNILLMATVLYLAAVSFSFGNNLQRKDHNVLLITVDTLRYDRISFYSDKYVKTPYMDRLAQKSFVFDWAFAHNSVTLPSHVNILTGTTPLYHGISDNRGFHLDEKFLTLAEFLKEKGYATGAFVGAFPVDSQFGLDQGFDEYDDHFGHQVVQEFYFVERPAVLVVQPALEWLLKQGKSKWFAWVHVFDPHEPYSPIPPFDKQYPDDPYSGEVAYTDYQLGVLLDFLRGAGMDKNTLIILASDHGEAFGEKEEWSHSYFAYNSTMHIPLIVHIPDAGHKRIAENSCHVDIFPTVLDVLGYNIPAHIQGESLLPLIEGKKRVNPEIYIESMTPYLTVGWAPLAGLINDNIKYIDQPIKEIYDFKADPAEKTNLANPTSVKLMAKQLDALRKKLRNKDVQKKDENVDLELASRLRSLGYVSMDTTMTTKRKKFTEKDDLKTMKPIQNKGYEAFRIYQEGREEEAVAILKGLTREWPGYITAFTLLSSIYYKQQRFEEAVSILEEGLKYNGDSQVLLTRLGTVFISTKRFRDAIKALEVCVRRNKYNAELFNYLGVAYQNNGETDKALENYKKAVALDSNFALAHNNIGSIYMLKFRNSKDPRDLERALDSFNNALAFNPDLQEAKVGRDAALKLKAGLEKRDFS